MPDGKSQYSFSSISNIINGEIISEGDKSFLSIKHSGKQEGRFLDIEPTGLTIEFDEIAVFTFKNGKILNIWILSDIFTLCNQLKSEIF